MRFGLIGTGYWAREIHGPGIVDHPDAELVGVWGRDPAKTESLATDLGTTPYDDVDRLIRDVDALTFAVPPDVQAPIAIAAAQAGKHLLLEKPIATSIGQARWLERAVLDGGVASVVFFTMRFAEGTAGWIDELVQTGGWECGRAEWAVAPLAEGSPFAGSAWRHEKGGLWDVGPHALAMLTAVLGDVVTVTAGAGLRDQVHLVLRHSSGASSTASLSLTTPQPAEQTTVYFYGEAGRRVLPGEPVPVEAAYGRAVDALLWQVRRSTPRHPCDASFGARVVEVLAAAERSLAEGQRLFVASH
jgi:predicted dehydrogenase